MKFDTIKSVRCVLLSWLGSLVIIFHSTVHAAEATPAQLQFFESKIRPILSGACYKCHSQSSEKLKGGLLLDTKEGALKGGETGAAIVPGDTEKSLLIKAVRYTDAELQMPPKGKKLSDQQIADLETWVKMGAPDPRVTTTAQKNWIDPNKKHWAWQPLTKPSPPNVKDAAWCKTPVDNFILAKLEEKNLKPSLPADKRTLIRRATFDLTGLPPATEDVEAFVKDESSDAFAKVVDRLLASPQYGERWGRHWLDVARYSDTKGQVKRQREDPNYPWAWTYRDYVIQSFNEDKPYNQFIVEQIAADKLPSTQRNPTNLVALGFLTVGDRFMGMPNDIINDRIDVVTKGFLGVTVTCARCHDHKFDPIPTKDYYSLHGVFASTTEPPIETIIQKNLTGPDYFDYFKKRDELDKEKERLNAEFAQFRKTRQRDQQKFREIQREIRQNAGASARLEMTHPGAPIRAMRVQDSTRPHDSRVFIRGEAGNQGEVAPRRFLSVVTGTNRVALTNGSGRMQLAQAIIDPKNPLTPRTMINRIWQHHFGVGFVPTPDDIGTMSEPPSHPELVDYLASQFVENGWSIKKIHRLIMLSSVYQESSATNPRYAEIDPENRLLWRANIRRLEFESIRDSLLAIGGTLSDTMYGRPVNFESNPNSTRRTIYGLVDRSDLPDALVNFDFANPDMPNGKRHDTTVPQQALFFMNSPLVIEQAKRIVAEKGFKSLTDEKAKVRFLYDRIYQRLPKDEELQLGLDFVLQAPPAQKVEVADAGPRAGGNGRPGQIAKQRFQQRNSTRSNTRDPLMPWEEYAHALLQANEVSIVN
ncbi:MAG: DUF1549 domain-containing protein [Verrucomicrobia bacterium]|nr:DUF1549 domain-containing protein [Verrucomicrobiota bacterium]